MAIDKNLQYELNTYKQVAASNNSFNAKEALKNRDFQERMSSTSHQREVQDLIKAGLNPVLSANAGASTPSGSMATADTSTNSAIATSFSSKRQAETALKTAQIQANATMAAAAASAGAQMYAAQKALEASKYSSDNSLRSSVFGSVTNAMANITNAQINRGNTLWGILSNALDTSQNIWSANSNEPTYLDINTSNAASNLMRNMDNFFGYNPNLLNVQTRSRNSWKNSAGRYHW